MENSQHLWITVASIVALVAIVSLVALATPHGSTAQSEPGLVGLATGTDSLGPLVTGDGKQASADCHGGLVVEANGNRWCCRDFGKERVCEQLGVPGPGEKCSSPNQVAWRNTVRITKATCTSSTCTRSTTTEYVARMQTIHQRLVCTGARWGNNGDCVLSRTGSCVEDGSARRCQSSLCGIDVTWFAQPMKVVHQDQPPRGEACRDLSLTVPDAALLAQLSPPINTESPATLAAALLPQCEQAK